MEKENLFYQVHFGFCQIARQGAGGLVEWVGVNPVLRIVNINTNLFSMTFSWEKSNYFLGYAIKIDYSLR